MIEMIEVANILNNATSASLVILDEVGRGTSTFDGLAIAWAVTEAIHDRVGARTLFATHYHELTELALVKPAVANYNVAVKEWQDQIVFLRRIVPGGTDRSYGVHVARLAGIPRDVVERARTILVKLEADELDGNARPRIGDGDRSARLAATQLSLFKSPGENVVIDALRAIDPDTLTPLEALEHLYRLKKHVR